jgi:hypothetical protein
MKNRSQILLFLFGTISFTACEHKPREIRMTFYQDTLINGVKTEKVLKTGRVKELTSTQRDSIEQLLTEAETVTEHYLVRAANEDTTIYLDKVIRHWHQDSLEEKIAKDQIYQAVAIRFGQTLVDNNNFEWKLFGNELIIEDKDEFGAERPYDISKRIIEKMDSLNLQKTKIRILRDVKIIKQLEELGRK